MRMASRSATLLIVLILTACSNARQPALLPSTPYAPANHDSALMLQDKSSGALLVRVTVHLVRRSHFLSPSSKGMTVDVKGPTKFKQTVGLTVRATGCKSKLMDLQCALRVTNLKPCPSNKACYTATIRTYDAYANKKIPPSAHLLSAIAGFRFSITSGTTVVPLVLDGVPKSVAFVPSESSALTGKQLSGFVFPKCTTAAQTVTLIGVDADGNYIVGPGAPTTSLTSGTPAQMSVSAGGAPNVFVIHQPVSPGYAYGNRSVTFSADAKPIGKDLGSGVDTNVKVTYSGDICGKLSEFPIPTATSYPSAVAPGPDGNVWFTECLGNNIGRIGPSGTIAEFKIPTAGAFPFGMTPGADGDLWFTESQAGKIGKIATGGSITEYAVPGGSGLLLNITAGPDGNLWFADASNNKIGKSSTGGSITEYPVTTGSSSPDGITTGPDGNIWFTEFGANKIGLITVGGSVTEFDGGVSPADIVTGFDGALWYTNASGYSIGRATIAGVTTSTYGLPGTTPVPRQITRGPDGALWFSEQFGDAIGRIAVSGNITEYPIKANSHPWGVTVGPDGAIWFAEVSSNEIGRIR